MKKNNNENTNHSLFMRLRLKGWLLLAPAFIMILFTMVIPLLWNVILCFSSWEFSGETTFVGMRNITDEFLDRNTWITLGRTLWVAFFSVGVAILIGILLAVLIYQVGKPLGSWYRYVFYSPAMLPVTVIGLLFTFVFAPDEGMLNNILRAIGLESFAIAWLSRKTVNMIVIGNVQGWRFSGTVMMLVFTAILTIPKSLFESAKLDGITYSKELFYIVFPLIRNNIAMVVTLLLIWSFKTYDIVWTMTAGGPGDMSKTTSLLIYQLAFNNSQFGKSAVLSFIYMFIILTIIGITRKVMQGEQYEF